MHCLRAVQWENCLLLTSRCLPIPSWLWRTKQVPAGRQACASDLFLWSSSFVSPESGVVCVNPQPMRGPGKRSRCLQGDYRKCRRFPAGVMLWSLLPRSQAWATVAGIHSLWPDLHREARFQESWDQVSAVGEETGEGRKETYLTHFRSALAW